MRYTLYIDESGDFESQKGQWVLSGMLFADTYENCEKSLTSKFSDIPKRLGLKSIKDFHLTDFRRDYGHCRAIDMAKQVLHNLNSLPFRCYFLATINQTKFSLSNKEKTYRLMLTDLLSLCETMIPDDDVIEKLDLVVASRTIEGELQTSISNINQATINSLPLALEVDLATKGMIDLIGRHIKIKMDYANNSWGLVCADFLANLNYNNKEKVEKKYLDELAEQGKYSLFESFGGYEIRRANVAERDKDYVLALYRWIVIYHKKNIDEQSRVAINRLLFKIFNQSGTSGCLAIFEALIERLWRNNNSIDQYSKLSNMLTLFDKELSGFLIDHNFQRHDGILFRLRNMILLLENHLGNIDKSLAVSNHQEAMINQLSSNPENFHMILDYKVHAIEISINSLAFDDALVKANEYYSMIENYKEIWKLLIDNDKLSNFNKSRANIKAEMVLIRCEILSNIVQSPTETEASLERLTDVRKILTNTLDISRLNNYKVMLFIKQRSPKKAVELYLSLYGNMTSEKLGYFDFFWLLHSVNDVLLHDKQSNIQDAKHGIEFQISLLKPDKKGHPIDLIWREVALYEHLTGNKSKALKAIRKSRNSFNLGKSPISKWLTILVDIHEDYINNKIKSIDQYFNDNISLGLMNSVSGDLTILQKARVVSPY